ncbi:hypothetical protein HDU98_009840 [Podochytrium sp. JEL0797]|nr:hypothetical protein HDU98_009840 [Podochytrium sp. JEL0797]
MPPKPRVLVTRLLPPLAQRRLATDPRITLSQWTGDGPIPRAELLNQIKGVEGALVLLTDRIDAEAVSAAGPQLKVVSTMSVGYDHISLPTLKPHGIKLGITPDVLTDASAELTVGLLLATARRFKEAIEIGKTNDWGAWNPTFLTGTQISGKTIGVIGFGRIGQAVANRLKPFNPLQFHYFSPSAKPAAEIEIGATRVPELRTFLNSSDIVIVTCKLTDETRGMLNAETLRFMKPTSILINTARGGIINHDDLYNALSSSQHGPGAAGLDVTDPEPFPANHKLHTLPNCLILPHIGSATMETREAMADLAVSNLLAGVFGEKLPASVEF